MKKIGIVLISILLSGCALLSQENTASPNPVDKAAEDFERIKIEDREDLYLIVDASANSYGLMEMKNGQSTAVTSTLQEGDSSSPHVVSIGEHGYAAGTIKLEENQELLVDDEPVTVVDLSAFSNQAAERFAARELTLWLSSNHTPNSKIEVVDRTTGDVVDRY